MRTLPRLCSLGELSRLWSLWALARWGSVLVAHMETTETNMETMSQRNRFNRRLRRWNRSRLRFKAFLFLRQGTAVQNVRVKSIESDSVAESVAPVLRTFWGIALVSICKSCCYSWLHTGLGMTPGKPCIIQLNQLCTIAETRSFAWCCKLPQSVPLAVGTWGLQKVIYVLHMLCLDCLDVMNKTDIGIQLSAWGLFQMISGLKWC